MTFADYRALPALNFSSLKPLAVSPLLFAYRRDHPREDTEALFFGRAFHVATLEPEKFAAEYMVAPAFGDCRAVAGRTTKEEGKANKLAKAAWYAENAGKTPLTAEDADRIAHMAAAVRAHRHASAALSGAHEQTITWVDEPTGLACKGRIDVLGRGVADLKTCRDPSPRAFGRDAAKLLYYAQMAWYHDGAIAGRLLDPAPPLLVAAQSEAPWDVGVYRVEQDALEAGRACYRRLLTRLVECHAAGWWPGVAPEIMPLQLPHWILNESTPEPSEDF